MSNGNADKTFIDFDEEIDGFNAPTTNETIIHKDKKSKWKLLGGAAIVIVFIMSIVIATKPSTVQVIFPPEAPASNAPDVPKENSNATVMKSAFFTTEGPLNTTIELLNKNVPNGYANKEELEDSIEKAAMFLVKIVHDREMNRTKPLDLSLRSAVRPKVNQEVSKLENIGNEMASELSQASKNSYGTNNQEIGVEEADIVVSDGEYVYAAYGKYIVVWKVKSGEIVKEIEMPPIDTSYLDSKMESDNYTDYYDEYYYYGWGTPEPTIKSLVLHEGRLLVTVEGYGPELQYQDDKGEGHVLFDYLATHLRLYDTTSMLVPNSETDGLMEATNINGRFNAIRAAGRNVHIITSSDVDTAKDLEEPFERSQLGTWLMANTAYSKMVQQLASTKIMTFTQKLMDDLRGGGSDEDLPRFARINSWRHKASQTSIRLEEQLYGEGLLNSLVLVSSMDLLGNTLQISSSSGAFSPSSWAEVYGNTDRIIVACDVSDYDEVTFTSYTSTALLAFEINGASSRPQSIGVVSGSILNSHSVDVVGDTLRVATSIQNTWLTEDEDWAKEENSATLNYVVVLNITSADDNDGGDMRELGRVRLGEPNETFTAVRFFGQDRAIASTFEIVDPFYVLDLSNNSNPKVSGHFSPEGFPDYFQSINEEDTLILSIGHSAGTDGIPQGIQLQLFDIQDPTNPTSIHTFDIGTNTNDGESWESSWTDSTYDFKATRFFDGQLIIPMSIDQSNQTGYSYFSGFLIFDVNVDGIEQKDCRIVNEDYSYIYGDQLDYYDNYTTWDQYYDDHDEYGHDNDEGEDSGNRKRKLGCQYYNGWLPSRSMFFDGKIMTMGGHDVVLTDINSCKNTWNVTIVVNESDGDCSDPYYGY